MRDFSKNVKNIIDSFLFEKGFEYSNGIYKKESPNGIRVIIGFDNMGIDNDSFNIVLFVNSVEIDEDNGAHCVQYFTGGSLSKETRKLSCKNKEALDSRLKRFINSYDEVIQPYFSSFTSCSSIADSLSSDIRLSDYRGDLYMISGEKGKAKKAFKDHILYLPTVNYLPKNLKEDVISKTKLKIRKCSLFAINLNKT